MESSSSSSSCCKRKTHDSVMTDSCEKRRKLAHISQDVVTVKDVCDLIQYVTLRHTHSVMKPSCFSVCDDDDRVSRVNVMILDGLTQSHFYRHFSHFKHLRNKYSSRWTLAPSSGDLLSELFNTHITESERPAETQSKLSAVLTLHPVIRRFGSKTAGLNSFLLTEQEMIKNNFPVKGGWGCEGFVCTQAEGPITDNSPLFGLDCEMCLTRVGLELTRVAVVDTRGHCVLNELVKPLNPIINYCTRFSGITQSMLAPVTTRLKDIQSKLLKLLPRDAVLVGHSLDNDLRVLNLIHPHVIDTSLLYRKENGQRFKLKLLAEVILKREIQSEEWTGHDPCEDALAALQLAQYFISKGASEVVECHLEDLWDMSPVSEDERDHVTSCAHHSSPPSFGHALYRSGQSALFLGRSADMSVSLTNQMCRRHHCSTDREVLCVFRRVVQCYSLSVLQFSSYSQTPATTRRQHLQQMCERLREMCVLFVGPLSSETTEKQIHKLFRRCGRLRTVRILHNTHGVHAVVEFEHLEGAHLALEHLNEHHINNCHIKVRRPVHESCLDLDECLSERHTDALNDHMMYVCNLSCKRRHHDDLLQTFKEFGPVQHIMSPAKHAGRRSRHAFIKFEHAQSVRAAVSASLQIGNRKLSMCHALTPPHMTSWTHTNAITTEIGSETTEQRDECDERLMKKLDAKVGKVFRSLQKNCLSVVILPGEKNCGAVEYLGLCFIQIKQDDTLLDRLSSSVIG
ncbi:RNA exonuclease 5-like isoform X2 [Myxocyprinus asiaticus]|uniref:RNA exonuclease 5-like isoform X2 n=1 Tax=Myxocyprinus asiaticus TaxID=70543 RepID=UPI002223D5DD|nr:RNA exonuclease 5-like isoform X2 [Myxocyprinus asiaticus]